MLPSSARHIVKLHLRDPSSITPIPAIISPKSARPLSLLSSSSLPSITTQLHKQTYNFSSSSSTLNNNTAKMSSGQQQQQQKIQKPKMNVHSFPRPPALEAITRHIQIKWDGQLIAETNEAYWVLETTHPPTYYLPLSALKVELQRSSKSSFCEWKGNATYWNVPKPNAAPGTYEKNRVWSYENPTKDFKPIKGYLSFYASPWDCYVDDEKVEAQPGDFYGGWMTSEIEGKVKGGPGTWGW